MKYFRNKLKNNEGKAMIIAMILMLVSIMVSSVILVSAADATKGVKNDVESQQAYLTVSSAVKLFEEEVTADLYEKKSGVYQTVDRESGSGWKNGWYPDGRQYYYVLREGSNYLEWCFGKPINERQWYNWRGYKYYLESNFIFLNPFENVDEASKFVEETECSKGFKEILSAGIAYYTTTHATEYTQTFYIKSNNFDDVIVTFKMDAQYNIYATFKLAKETSHNCVISVTIDADYVIDTTEEEVFIDNKKNTKKVYTNKVTIKWNTEGGQNVIITKGE